MWMCPKCNYKCVYKRKVERFDTEKEANVTTEANAVLLLALKMVEGTTGKEYKGGPKTPRIY